MVVNKHKSISNITTTDKISNIKKVNKLIGINYKSSIKSWKGEIKISEDKDL